MADVATNLVALLTFSLVLEPGDSVHGEDLLDLLEPLIGITSSFHTII
jgi:hypothetical protein